MKRKKAAEGLTTLPQGYERVMLIELKANAKEGTPLYVRYGGTGMEPMLKGGKDRVYVVPVTADYEPKRLDVLALEKDGKCVFRRFLRTEGNLYVVRGDSCYAEERITREAIVGRLKEVERPNGSRITCESDAWTKRSEKVVRRRSSMNRFRGLFEGKRGKYWAAGYYALLLIVMWMPLGEIALDNLILGLRPDHLFHASIYCFSAYFLWILCGRRPKRGAWMTLIWLGSLAIGVATEYVQRLLPYRSFDVNDLLANGIGVTLGWLVLAAVVTLNSRKEGNHGG